MSSSSSSLVSIVIHIPHQPTNTTTNIATTTAKDTTVLPRRALECLAHACQVPVSMVYDDNNNNNNNNNNGLSSSSSLSSLYGVVTMIHPLTRQQVMPAMSCVGWIGCARAICTTGGGGGNSHSSSSSVLWNAAVEAWMESAVNTVLPLWTTTTTTEDSNDSNNNSNRMSVLTRAIQDFGHQVHTYLFQHDATYLVGDSMTAADVCVALWLVYAAMECSITTLPSQCHRWMMTVLQSPMILPFAPPDSTTWPTTAAAVASSDEEEMEWMKRRMAAHMNIVSPKDPATQVTVSATTITATTLVEEPTMLSTSTTTTSTTATKELPAMTTTTTTTESTATTTATVTATSTTTETTPATTNPIIALLQQLGLDHEVYTHVPCMTADELVANVPLPPTESHTKNLLLRDKKHGLVLLVVAPSTAVHTKDMGTFLKLPAGTKTNFRLADEATLLATLQCAPGCVGPLCMVHDHDHAITHLIVDAQLLDPTKVTYVHSHPMRNDTSVKVTPAVLLEYWKKNGVLEPTIVDFGASTATTAAVPAEKAAAPKKTSQPSSSEAAAAAKIHSNKKQVKKGETQLALQWKKDENFAMWYSDVIVLSEMIAYYDISGCYILRPWSYKIWELIQEWFNKEIRALGVENSYFPLFVSQDRLEREKDHVEGFAPEVAWVTKSGDGELAKPIAIRPTSETIMYPAFSDWIRSHRDLPLLLNQWSNVVRWEFKDPTPFLRSREFLWQEGHTAHSSFDEANTMVRAALELYRRVYEELLAVPVIPGYKTEKEKFAGGHTTTTVEAYIAGSGRAIQGATSHHLGQNFGKMFDITFQDEHGQTQTAWQTSWGLTTRTIGVMIMVHGDDKGLVLPPRISPQQVVIVPIISKNLLMEDAKPYCQAVLEQLQQADMRAKYDDREMYNPGWKYNHWEQKGVPIRIEVGPRDIEQKQVRVVVRYSGEKFDLSIDALAEALQKKLEEIQEAMLAKAKVIRDAHVVQVTDWKDFVPNLELNHLVLTPWCGGEHKDWEEWVKTKSREESLNARGGGEEDARTSTSVAAKTLCIPFAQPELPEGAKCIASGLPATCWVLWGRSY